VLWQVLGYGRQVVPPGTPYWYENKVRRPLGVVYCQYTVSGPLVYRDRQGERAVPVGSLLLFRHGEATAYGRPPSHDGEAYRCEWIGMVGAGVDAHWTLLQERYGALIELGDDRTLRNALNRLIDLAGPRAGASTLARAVGCQAFMMELFAGLESRIARRRNPVESAIADIMGNPTAIRTLKQIARSHGVSREHLARAFHQRVGRAPAAWLTEARIARALQLLRDTALPIGAVAEQSGFPSAHTLARQVKRTTGKSPMVFRRDGSGR
jgi:AraC-like DNA-binding protein